MKEKLRKRMHHLHNNIRRRCENPKDSYWYRYGKRGIKCLITVDELIFLWNRDNASALKEASVDRINSDGNYELSNCRFIERYENAKPTMFKEGSLNPKAKLTPGDVLFIRKYYAENGRWGSVTFLQEKFKVRRCVLYDILNRKSWRNI